MSGESSARLLVLHGLRLKGFSEAPGIDSTVTHVPPSSLDVESFGVGLVVTLKHAVLTAAATRINDK